MGKLQIFHFSPRTQDCDIEIRLVKIPRATAKYNGGHGGRGYDANGSGKLDWRCRYWLDDLRSIEGDYFDLARTPTTVIKVPSIWRVGMGYAISGRVNTHTDLDLETRPPTLRERSPGRRPNTRDKSAWKDED